MKFPDDARTILDHREAADQSGQPGQTGSAGKSARTIRQAAVEPQPRGPILEQTLSPKAGGSGAATTIQATLESTSGAQAKGAGFVFRWNPADTELRPLLRRADDARDVFLERLELVLRPGDGLSSISLDPGIPVDTRYHIFQHGFQSWSLSGLRERGEADRFARLGWKHKMDENPETPHQSNLPFTPPFFAFPAKGRFHSEHLVGLEEEIRDSRETGDGRSPARVVVYAAGHGNQNIRFRVRLDPHSGRLLEFTVIWDFNGCRFSKHGRESLTPVAWNIETPGAKSERRTFAGLLNESMAKLATNFVRKRPRNNGVVGWCSWYYYYTKITEDITLDNLSQLARSDLKIDLFQIDDGWQRAIGDWTETNKKFPAGMKYLADEIKKTGMRPGIWLAPFLIQKNAELMRSHPDIILRDQKGEPVKATYNPNWGGWAYCLDVTHPRYKEWIADTIQTIVKRWGYSYLKIDFLFTAGYRGRVYDDTTTAAGRTRDALALIRKAAGKDTFILGCGAPMWPSVGQVDAMRISVDVNHIWSGDLMSWLLRDRNYPNVRGALINTLTRSYMHNRFWINDPDCLMVRGRDTKLTLEQVYLMSSVMALSGGMLLLSDDLTHLEADRFEIFARAIELNRKCAPHTPLPLGMLEYHFPRGYYNPAGFLGVWNSSSGPDRIQIPVPAGVDEGALRNAHDYWTGNKIAWQIENNRIHIALAPFESVVAVL